MTNRAPWVGTWVTGRVSCAILDLSTNSNFGGVVYFDSLQVTATNIAANNSQSGAIWNPGFEYTANGTKLQFMDNWTNLGFAGNVDSAMARTGNNGLKLYAPETLSAQYWTAAAGSRYATTGFVATAAGSDRLQGATNLHAVVLLQYLNATGGILVTYESGWFTTNSAPGTWTGLVASGVAPNGTVAGRTVLGLLGTNAGFAGAVWFDDVGQSLVSTGMTVSGVLYNPSFEDGPPGNCSILQTNHDLPAWTWNGGTNAGYIATDHVKAGQQALVITYPQNGVAQDWTCVGGHTYSATGSLFTPSSAKFSTDGTAYGMLDLAFYANGFYVTNYTSARFGASQAANVWTTFTVSATAPAGTNITGRLTCTIYSPNPGDDFDLGGVIYFDDLSVVDTQAQTNQSAWAQWQTDNFGSTNGANTGTNQDYDGDGYNNWNEFIAGTQPTNSSSFLSATAQRQTSGSGYVIRWPSVNGRYYGLWRTTNIMTAAMSSVVTSIAGAAPENSYTDSPPAGVSVYYYRVSVTTNHP